MIVLHGIVLGVAFLVHLGVLLVLAPVLVGIMDVARRLMAGEAPSRPFWRWGSLLATTRRRGEGRVLGHVFWPVVSLVLAVVALACEPSFTVGTASVPLSDPMSIGFLLLASRFCVGRSVLREDAVAVGVLLLSAAALHFGGRVGTLGAFASGGGVRGAGIFLGVGLLAAVSPSVVPPRFGEDRRDLRGADLWGPGLAVTRYGGDVAAVAWLVLVLDLVWPEAVGWLGAGWMAWVLGPFWLLARLVVVSALVGGARAVLWRRVSPLSHAILLGGVGVLLLLAAP